MGKNERRIKGNKPKFKVARTVSLAMVVILMNTPDLGAYTYEVGGGGGGTGAGANPQCSNPNTYWFSGKHYNSVIGYNSSTSGGNMTLAAPGTLPKIGGGKEDVPYTTNYVIITDTWDVVDGKAFWDGLKEMKATDIMKSSKVQQKLDTIDITTGSRATFDGNYMDANGKTVDMTKWASDNHYEGANILTKSDPIMTSFRAKFYGGSGACVNHNGKIYKDLDGVAFNVEIVGFYSSIVTYYGDDRGVIFDRDKYNEIVNSLECGEGKYIAGIQPLSELMVLNDAVDGVNSILSASSRAIKHEMPNYGYVYKDINGIHFNVGSETGVNLTYSGSGYKPWMMIDSVGSPTKFFNYKPAIAPSKNEIECGGCRDQSYNKALGKDQWMTQFKINDDQLAEWYYWRYLNQKSPVLSGNIFDAYGAWKGETRFIRAVEDGSDTDLYTVYQSQGVEEIFAETIDRLNKEVIPLDIERISPSLRYMQDMTPSLNQSGGVSLPYVDLPKWMVEELDTPRNIMLNLDGIFKEIQRAYDNGLITEGQRIEYQAIVESIRTRFHSVVSTDRGNIANIETIPPVLTVDTTKKTQEVMYLFPDKKSYFIIPQRDNSLTDDDLRFTYYDKDMNVLETRNFNIERAENDNAIDHINNGAVLNIHQVPFSIKPASVYVGLTEQPLGTGIKLIGKLEQYDPATGKLTDDPKVCDYTDTKKDTVYVRR